MVSDDGQNRVLMLICFTWKCVLSGQFGNNTFLVRLWCDSPCVRVVLYEMFLR